MEGSVMVCPVCRGGRMVEIGVNLRDAKLTMHSCSKCETRWWESDGRRVELDGVFSLAAPQK